MTKRPAGKSVTDYFISGVEIDAAVRRAVREAVALDAAMGRKTAKQGRSSSAKARAPGANPAAAKKRSGKPGRKRSGTRAG